MTENGLPAAPRHPTVDSRSLVAWPGYHSGLKVDAFDRRIVGAIAKPLAHAAKDAAFIESALKAGLGVVLPSQTWCNQLPGDHRKRAGGFADLSVHRPGLQFDPGGGRLRPAWAEKYASDDLEDQLLAGATLALTAAHVHEEECRDGRQNDLLLARLEAEEFVARRAFNPAPGRDGRRELYATLIVQGRHAAEPMIIDWLIRAYADLADVSGYWIIGANSTGSGRQLTGYVRLALELERLTDRPTVTSCVGDPHLALLASGVAATCAGLHGMSFRFPPEELPTGKADDDDDASGLGIYTYHRATLGNAGPLGDRGAAIRTALFRNRPCRCDHHEPNQPPIGRAQIVAHNLSQLQADARAIAGRAVVEAEAYINARVQIARRHRRLLGMSRLSPGFTAVSIEAKRLRETRDDAAEG